MGSGGSKVGGEGPAQAPPAESKAVEEDAARSDMVMTVLALVERHCGSAQTRYASEEVSTAVSATRYSEFGVWVRHHRAGDSSRQGGTRRRRWEQGGGHSHAPLKRTRASSLGIVMCGCVGARVRA